MACCGVAINSNNLIAIGDLSGQVLIFDQDADYYFKKIKIVNFKIKLGKLNSLFDLTSKTINSFNW